MTQRDNAVVIDLHGSSDSEERQSVIQPISAMCAADDSSQDEACMPAGRETAAAETIEAAGDAEAVPASAAAITPDGRADRPTLMGLAPIELDAAEHEANAASQLSAAGAGPLDSGACARGQAQHSEGEDCEAHARAGADAEDDDARSDTAVNAPRSALRGNAEPSGDDFARRADQRARDAEHEDARRDSANAKRSALRAEAEEAERDAARALDAEGDDAAEEWSRDFAERDDERADAADDDANSEVEAPGYDFAGRDHEHALRGKVEKPSKELAERVDDEAANSDLDAYARRALRRDGDEWGADRDDERVLDAEDDGANSGSAANAHGRALRGDEGSAFESGASAHANALRSGVDASELPDQRTHPGAYAASAHERGLDAANTDSPVNAHGRALDAELDSEDDAANTDSAANAHGRALRGDEGLDAEDDELGFDSDAYADGPLHADAGDASAATAHARAVAKSDAPTRAPTVATWVGPMPSEQARLPDEGDPEWLDLSTRWLIAAGPQTDQDISDDSEVTNEMHWADHLAAGVRLRAESQSSAPPPPQPPPPAAKPARHVTIAYGLPSEAPAVAPAAFEPQAPRQWAPPATRQTRQTRHPTLAGISPLPEDQNSWPPPDMRGPADPYANDVRAPRTNEREPWGEEPSYNDSQKPHAPRQSWAPVNNPAPVGTLPPWAAMSMYAPPPSAAAMPPYAAASWSAPHLAPPPWAAAPHYAAPVQNTLAPQFYATGTYAAAERHPSQRIEYAAPRRPTGSVPLPRREHARTSQPNGGEVTLEQWKNLANSWMGAVGKLAIAAMALHYSGLAVPLLGQFGYTPAAAAPAASPSGANELAVRAPAGAAASLAAASVIADPTRAARDMSPRRVDSPPLANDAESAPQASSHWRRPGGKRESSGATESSSLARRRSSKSAHSHKPARSARTSEPQDAVAAARQDAVEPQPSEPQLEQATEPARTTEQLMAAATGASEAAGESFLRINSRPWSQVFVDGTLVGTTPKIDLRVSAGPHRIRLVNPELGLSKTFQIDAPAGETVSHVEHLDE